MSEHRSTSPVATDGLVLGAGTALDAGRPEAGRGEVQSVTRALSLLAGVIDAGPDVRLSAVARSVGLTTSTAHRLLRTMVASGFVAYDRETERYSTGPALVRAAFSIAGSSELFEVGAIVDGLAQRTGESVSLDVRSGTCVAVVVSGDSPAPFNANRQTGSRSPLHLAATGKAILAFGPSGPAASVAELGDLVGSTPFSLTSAKVLVEDLERTRARGYAVADEEERIGFRSIAAPVFTRTTSSASLAVGVSGPISRLTNDRTDEIADAVVEVAATLSEHPALALAFAPRPE